MAGLEKKAESILERLESKWAQVDKFMAGLEKKAESVLERLESKCEESGNRQIELLYLDEAFVAQVEQAMLEVTQWRAKPGM